MRRILEAISDVFSNALVDAILSAMAAILLWPQVKFIADLNFLDTKRIFFYIVSIVAVAVFLRITGVFFN